MLIPGVFAISSAKRSKQAIERKHSLTGSRCSCGLAVCCVRLVLHHLQKQRPIYAEHPWHMIFGCWHKFQACPQVSEGRCLFQSILFWWKLGAVRLIHILFEKCGEKRWTKAPTTRCKPDPGFLQVATKPGSHLPPQSHEKSRTIVSTLSTPSYSSSIWGKLF